MRRIQVESFISVVCNGLQRRQGGVPMRRTGTRTYGWKAFTFSLPAFAHAKAHFRLSTWAVSILPS